MSKVTYTSHLRLRLKVREIPENYPLLIYKNPDQKYYDVVEEKFIAIKKLKYNKEIRDMMIAYEEKDELVEIITIHPITQEKIVSRIMNERWIKNE